jgi:hypothetical protein
MTLYHGTTIENAALLLQDGWRPNQAPVGANSGGQDRLYLSTDPTDAAFFGYVNSGDDVPHIVLAVEVSVDALAVDPEDSLTMTVENELAHAADFPGRLTVTHALAPDPVFVLSLT